MRNRDLSILLCLLLVGLPVVPAAASELSDENGQVEGPRFKGSMSSCLHSTVSLYPCVSLSPPAYQPHPQAATMAYPAPDLPLDEGNNKQASLFSMKKGEHGYWNPKWEMDRRTRFMNMTMSVAGSGAEMHMKADSGLRFDIYMGDNKFAEPRYFLGLDRRW